MDELEPIFGLGEAHDESVVEVGGSSATKVIPLALVVVVALVVLINVVGGGRSGSDTEAAESSVPASPTTDATTTTVPEPTTSAPTTSGATTSTATSSPVITEGIPIRLPNSGIDAWLFARSGLNVTRIDLSTGERQSLDLEADVGSPSRNLGGRMTALGDQVVIVYSDRIVLMNVDSMEVEVLDQTGMRFLAVGDNEVWTASGFESRGNRIIHRVPIDDTAPFSLDMETDLPFPFLTAAPVPGGLLIGELLGSTWMVDDLGGVSRRDDIGALLAAGDNAYIASSCDADEMLCSVAIHRPDGSKHAAVIDNNFSFQTPLSPNGRWLASPGGFLDLETGTRLPGPDGIFGSILGGWSADSRWYVEPTPAFGRLHDLSGEFEALAIEGIAANTELQLILR